ncbi:transcriptional regulator [Tianweitania sp.]|uniref:transcriptional regulator n=1 Tax=Tianweitania sp. TaxID=2021634 RepID=UPI002896FFA7|nr:transcriptional regulator [Tianweitania sp.]
MPQIKPAQATQSHARQDVELADQYRQIGSAAILGALAARMKQEQAESDNGQKRSRQAA